MVEREDLEKLFDAALHERQAPSRFGTPLEQRKAGPSAFQKSGSGELDESDGATPYKPILPSSNSVEPVEEKVFQAAPAEVKPVPEVELCAAGAVSLDQTLNKELAAILDEKIAKEKRSKRRSRLTVLLFFIVTLGGGTGWVVANPARYEAFKSVLSEIRSVADIGKMVDSYKKSLDKVAERGNQINAAAESMGVDVSKVDENDGVIDAEMKEMMGEDGGKTTGERNKMLKDKFKSVEEKGKIGGGN